MAPVKRDSNLSDLTPSESNASSEAQDGLVRQCSMRDLPAAAASLAESFADDHVSHYFLDPTLPPEHPANAALHQQLMTAIVAMHIMRGLVTAAGPEEDPFACVALWCPPGTHTDGLATLLKSGLWRMHYKLSREARARMFDEFFPLLSATKASVLGSRDTRSWYLVYLGTRPSGRGLGLARRSVEWVTRRADAQGAPCYLESSNEANPPIYRRWGFEIARSIALKRDLQQGPISLDIMVREPRREPQGLDASVLGVEKNDTIADDAKSGIFRLGFAKRMGRGREGRGSLALNHKQGLLDAAEQNLRSWAPPAA